MEDSLALLLGSLDFFPALANASGGAGLSLAENVRMPPDELRVHATRDRLEVARALLREEQGKEVHLEKQIAELIRQLRLVARDGGVRDLIGLLDRVRNDRPLGLLAVPRAVAAQPERELLELDERLGEAHPVVVVGVVE